MHDLRRQFHQLNTPFRITGVSEVAGRDQVAFRVATDDLTFQVVLDRALFQFAKEPATLLRSVIETEYVSHVMQRASGEHTKEGQKWEGINLNEMPLQTLERWATGLDEGEGYLFISRGQVRDPVRLCCGAEITLHGGDHWLVELDLREQGRTCPAGPGHYWTVGSKLDETCGKLVAALLSRPPLTPHPCPEGLFS